MRALLRGERTASPLVMGALAALFLMAVTMLLLAAGYRNQFFDLKHVIYQRCQQRATYDNASQAARAAQLDYYQRLIVNLHHNPSPQNARFNADLEVSARQVIDKLQGALASGVPQGCNQYR